jgi:hypothetical protein
VLDASGLKSGDVAGLALLNLPYAWIGVRREDDGFVVEQFNQATGATSRAPLSRPRVWLRAQCDFLTEQATFAFSADGEKFRPIGETFTMVFQLKTFQGVRYSLFAFNAAGAPGGSADFDRFTVDEPNPRGLMRPIPLGRAITLTAHALDAGLGVKDGAAALVSAANGARFTVLDRGLGRVALRADDGRLFSVDHNRVTLTRAEPTAAETFQWIENVYGDLLLLSLATNRYVHLDSATGAITADQAGPAPSRDDGTCLTWTEAAP